nr:MAG TPA: hypothetical protein [Caudoviricetes sp.]
MVILLEKELIVMAFALTWCYIVALYGYGFSHIL